MGNSGNFHGIVLVEILKYFSEPLLSGYHDVINPWILGFNHPRRSLCDFAKDAISNSLVTS